LAIDSSLRPLSAYRDELGALLSVQPELERVLLNVLRHAQDARERLSSLDDPMASQAAAVTIAAIDEIRNALYGHLNEAWGYLETLRSGLGD